WVGTGPRCWRRSWLGVVAWPRGVWSSPAGPATAAPVANRAYRRASSPDHAPFDRPPASFGEGTEHVAPVALRTARPPGRATHRRPAGAPPPARRPTHIARSRRQRSHRARPRR